MAVGGWSCMHPKTQGGRSRRSPAQRAPGERSLTKGASCRILKALMTVKQGTPHCHFALSPRIMELLPMLTGPHRVPRPGLPLSHRCSLSLGSDILFFSHAPSITSSTKMSPVAGYVSPSCLKHGQQRVT